MLRLQLTAAFLLPIGLVAAIILVNSYYIPLWDSQEYLTACILPAVAKPFQFMSFNCSNHGTFVFGLLYAALQYVDSGNIFFIHLTSLILMMGALSFWYLILKYLFKTPFWIGLGMALICCNPAIVANSLNPTPDLVLFAFSILCIWGFLTRHLNFAMVSGITVVFSKEIGLIYYGICYLFYFLLLCPSTTRTKLIILMTKLCVPFFLYFIYLVFKSSFSDTQLFYYHTKLTTVLYSFLFSPPDHLRLYGALSALFLLNYQWIITAVMLSCFIFVFFRFCVIKPRINQYSLDNEIAFILCIFICIAFIFLRTILAIKSSMPFFLNVRYFLFFFPLTTILFLYVLKNFLPKLTYLVGPVTVMLFLFSCFRTIDPVSAAVYGTFAFGKRNMLIMTSPTGECCGYGRDQLVYNLEHIQIQKIVSKFTAQLHLQKYDAFLIDPLANHHLPFDIPIYSNVVEAKQKLKMGETKRIYYIDFPNLPNDAFRQKALKLFDPFFVTTIEHDGYKINFIEGGTKSFT